MSTEGGKSDIVFNSPTSRWVGARGKSSCPFLVMGIEWNLIFFSKANYTVNVRVTSDQGPVFHICAEFEMKPKYEDVLELR